jgi:DNA polymerase III subunit delta'
VSAAAGSAAVPPWLTGQTELLRKTFAQQRFPHALLIHEAPGSGGEWLALWAAQLVLCRGEGAPPCGTCVACRRVAAGQHPDLTWMGLVDEAKQLRIEQVRELAAELSLTSHGGGYKVGVIAPADALNRYAANALLKTLEEPPARTLLILVASAPSRLPATVLSRCQRLRISAPERAAAIAWLTSTRGRANWEGALEVLGDAPFLAATGDPDQLAEVGLDTRRTLQALTQGGADPVATAERWARSELPLRLKCFENWLTERIRGGGGDGGFLTEMRPAPYLSGGGAFLNIRELFGLVDELRDLRATLDVPLNKGLALEGMFRRLVPSRGRAAG